jgi:hypothetical protein
VICALCGVLNLLQTVKIRNIPFKKVHPGWPARPEAEEIWEAMRGRPVKIDLASVVIVQRAHSGHCVGRHWSVYDPDFAAIMEGLFGKKFPLGTSLCEHQVEGI